MAPGKPGVYPFCSQHTHFCGSDHPFRMGACLEHSLPGIFHPGWDQPDGTIFKGPVRTHPLVESRAASFGIDHPGGCIIC